MKRTAATLAALAILTGCASTHTAPTQAYRLKGADKASSIQGSILSDGTITTNLSLTVTIDGRPALTGHIGAGNKDIAGTFDGRPIMALCHREDMYSGAFLVHCRIIIDGEMASTLTF